MDAWSAIAVLGASAVKFLFAAAVSYGLKHTFLQTVLLLAVGGGATAAVSYGLGRRLLEWSRMRRMRRNHARRALGLEPKPSFTRINRFIVRLKRSYGLFMVALLPPILSIPLTALIAAKYFRHDERTVPVLLAAVAGWSLVLSAAWGFMR